MRRSLLLALTAMAALLLCAPTAVAQRLSFLGKPLTRWMDELRHDQPEVRRSAAFALGMLGDEAFLALSGLKKILAADQDAGVREMAALAMGDIVLALRGGTQTWDDLGGALERTLGEDPDPRVRRAAAYALGAFGHLAAPACASLQKALGHHDPAVRQNAAWALGRLGAETSARAVADLCERLKDSDVLVRRDAAAALGAIGRPVAREAAKPLLELAGVTSEDLVVRKTAVGALVKLVGTEHAEAGRALYPLLEGADRELAREAAFVLAKMGGAPAVKALEVLRKGLDDDDAAVQVRAAVSLAEIGRPAAPLVPDLARALDPMRHPEVRISAAIALSHIGEKARDAVPALVQCLSLSEQAAIRRSAANALAYLHYPANAKALPAVVEALRKDPDQDVRHLCVLVCLNLPDLKQHGADKALIELLDDPAPLRYDAARALAFGLRDQAPDKVPELLLEFITNKEFKVYHGIDAKVSSTGSEASKGQTEVMPNLSGDARYMAAHALRFLGRKVAKDPRVLDALKTAARDSDTKLRQQAEASLKVLNEAAK